MRNLILFIPGVIILNKLFGLNGVIASQPVVEGILAVICVVMYLTGVGNIRDVLPYPRTVKNAEF
ncbi:MAG: hypothetical protein II993_00465, partial [Anaerotignum sp.]|nr:hypothetical protein [Anaerotignum sp.]